MMRCNEVQEKLGNGAPDPELSGHVESCAECADRARTMRILGSWNVTPAPFDLLPRLQKRLARPRWPLYGAAAALLLGIGVALYRKPQTRSLPPQPTAVAQIERHLRLASFQPGEVPTGIFPYREAYDEALSANEYGSFAVNCCASFSAAPLQGLPPGALLQRSLEGHAVYWTPLGELSIFRTAEPIGALGTHTVLTQGHEIKISRFPVGTDEVTLMSEGLPWPELDRIQDGF